jgi:hypothetical protein
LTSECPFFVARYEQAALSSVVDEWGNTAWGEALLSDDIAASRQWKRCPYADSRENHRLPMNVSALRDMTRVWRVLMSIVGNLREVRALARTSSHPPDIRDAVSVTNSIMSLSAYVAGRKAGLPSFGYPGPLSALTKAYLDIEVVVKRRFFDDLAAGDSLSTPSGATLYAVADANQNLIGTRGVCAGPPHMIREAMDVLTQPTADDLSLGVNELARWHVDVGDYARYAEIFEAIDWLRYSVRCAMQDVIAEIAAYTSRSTWSGTPALVMALEQFAPAAERFPWSFIHALPRPQRGAILEGYVKGAAYVLPPPLARIVQWSVSGESGGEPDDFYFGSDVPADLKRLLMREARLESRALAAVRELTRQLAVALGRRSHERTCTASELPLIFNEPVFRLVTAAHLGLSEEKRGALTTASEDQLAVALASEL